MPTVKSFTQAQWDAVADRLDALPEKPAHEHRVNVRDAVKLMQSRLTRALSKGYTIDEIVQTFALDGVRISTNTLRYAMQSAARDSHIESSIANSEPVGTGAKPKAKNSRTKSSKGGDIRAGQSRDGEGPVSRPDSLVIRDAFSFEITPDVENL